MTADWMMVIITAIYVIATIFISVANVKAANATREQLKESKHQYDETKRMSIMPCLNAEFTFREEKSMGSMFLPNKININIRQTPESDKYTKNAYYMLHMENIGSGAIRNLSVHLKNCDILFDQGSDMGFDSLGVDKSKDIYFEATGGFDSRGSDNEIYAELIFGYTDLIGNKYNQIISITFGSNETTSMMFISKYSISDVTLCDDKEK